MDLSTEYMGLKLKNPIVVSASPLSGKISNYRRLEDLGADPAHRQGYDLVICRAGAMTVFELAAAGVGSILIPYPHAVDDHQTRNAEFLVENDAALLLQESQTDARKLANALSSLAGDRARLASMAARGRAVAVPDSASRVAELCRGYVTS